MRKLILLLTPLLLFLFCGCHENKIERQLSSVDSLLEPYPDSALKMVKKIDRSQLINKSDCAYYGLVFTEALYKNYIKVRSDSMIAASMTYYKSRHDVDKYVRSAFYRGAVIADNGNTEAAIPYYKMAEEKMNETDDYIIRYRICEYLIWINRDCNDYNIQLQYAKLSLYNAQKAENKMLTAYAFQNMALTYMYLEEKDSALLYINKALGLVKYCTKDGQAGIYQDLGVVLLYCKEDYTHAKKYILQSYHIIHDKRCLTALDMIFVKKGLRPLNTDMSINWSDDLYEQAERLSYLSLYYKNEKQYIKSITCLQRYDSIMDRISQKENKQKGVELQKKYDLKSQKKKAETLIWRIVSIFSLIITITIIVLYVNCRKTVRIKREIKEKENLAKLQIRRLIKQGRKQKTNYETKYLDFKERADDNIREIKLLEHKISSQNDEKSMISKKIEVYTNGITYLFDLLNGQGIGLLSTSQLRELIECYKLYDKSFIHILDSLTAREKVYCILLHQKISRQEVAAFLSLSPSADKMTRHRIREKLEEEIISQFDLDL